MRKLILLSLALVFSVAGLLTPATAARCDYDNCVTYCTVPDACGYSCCYQECCGDCCVFLACPPPLPCGEDI